MINSYKLIAKCIDKTGLFYFRTPRRIHKKIVSRLSNNPIIHEGLKVFTNPNDDDNFIIKGFGQHKDIQKIINSKVKQGDITVDIGANVGRVSLLLSRKVKYEGVVFAFEPEKENYSIMLRNIKENNITNIIPIRMAVSNSSGVTYLDKGKSTTHKITEKKTETKINTVSMDDYFKDQKIDFVKIDAEGAEPKIIWGMKNIIEQNPQLKIVIEYNHRIMDGNVGYLRELEEYGFKLYDMMKEKFTSPAEIVSTYYDEPHLTNIYCDRA